MKFPNIASFLKSATTNINITSATAPSNGQVLTATSSTTATWQTPSAGNVASTKSTFIAGENITAPAYVRKGVTALGEDTTKIYKTDASNIDKINAIGSIGTTVTSGNSVAVDTGGIANYWTLLTTGSDYYLGETASGVTDSSTIQQLTNWGGGSDNQTSFGKIVGNSSNRTGQTFTTVTDRIVRTITVTLSKVGSPTDNVGCRIYASDKITLLATASNVIAGTSITTGNVSYTFNFNDFVLQAGVVYFIETYRTGTTDNSNFYNWEKSSTTNPYAGGSIFYSTDGTNWNTGSYDKSFTIQMGTGTINNISTTPGTNVRRIGKAISTTAIELETSANNSLEGTLGTTATTGSVTLGNAVGYVTVKINGVDRKIPYYS